jgi:hypothetical protein
MGGRRRGGRGEKFRERAAECRALVEQSHKSLDKEHWLTLAEQWLKMAQEADLATE